MWAERCSKAGLYKNKHRLQMCHHRHGQNCLTSPAVWILVTQKLLILQLLTSILIFLVQLVWMRVISAYEYAESVGKGKYFWYWSFLVSLYIPSSIDQSNLIKVLHAFACRWTVTVECKRSMALLKSQPIDKCLMVICILFVFLINLHYKQRPAD